jgi:hypothetical protein
MSWFAITGFCSKSWAWLQENWKVPLVAVYTIVVWVLARGNIDAVKNVLAARKKAHIDEVNSLKGQHKEELELRDQSIKEYQEAVRRVEEEFRKRGEILEEVHREKIKEIVSADPSLTRKKIEEEFGFTYVEVD